MQNHKLSFQVNHPNVKFVKELYSSEVLGGMFTKGLNWNVGVAGICFTYVSRFILPLGVHLRISQIVQLSNSQEVQHDPWQYVNILTCYYRCVLFSPVWSKSQGGFAVPVLFCGIGLFNKAEELKRQQSRHLTNLTSASSYSNFPYLWNFHKLFPV